MIFHRLPSGSRRRVGKTLSVLTWRCWWRPTSSQWKCLRLKGLITYYVLFFIHLESRRICLAGITHHPARQGSSHSLLRSPDETMSSICCRNHAAGTFNSFGKRELASAQNSNQRPRESSWRAANCCTTMKIKPLSCSTVAQRRSEERR